MLTLPATCHDIDLQSCRIWDVQPITNKPGAGGSLIVSQSKWRQSPHAILETPLACPIPYIFRHINVRTCSIIANSKSPCHMCPIQLETRAYNLHPCRFRGWVCNPCDTIADLRKIGLSDDLTTTFDDLSAATTLVLYLRPPDQCQS